jgi:hypothetical protein
MRLLGPFLATGRTTARHASGMQAMDTHAAASPDPYNAFIDAHLTVEGAPSGPLKGLAFAAKDLFDVSLCDVHETSASTSGVCCMHAHIPSPACVHGGRLAAAWRSRHADSMTSSRPHLCHTQVAGHRTGFGNPVWLETHPPAASTAPPVQVGMHAPAAGCSKRPVAA